MSATLGLDAARALDPSGYSMSGTLPRFAVRPANREELSEALRASTSDRLGVVPWGGGVALSRESAPSNFDVALDLRALDRVIEYEPDDLTLTAECGCGLDALRDLLRERGQELPLEAAQSWGATLGGVLAANAGGPRRMALGAPRDRILGARFALGSGEIVRTGGKVVKNVAGYGVHRMLCGSRGALAVIVEASLKLNPAPVSRAALVFGAEPSRLAEERLWLPLVRMEPAVFTVLGRAVAELHPVLAGTAPCVLVVGFEGEAAQVERQCQLVREMLGSPRHRVSDASAAVLWQQIADFEELHAARLSFTTAQRTPSALAHVMGRGFGDRFVFHAASGRLHLFSAGADPGEIARRLAEHGFALIDLRGVGDIAPALPPQLAVAGMRDALRNALDPGRRFALGERWS